jgi:hypothetical protein
MAISRFGAAFAADRAEILRRRRRSPGESRHNGRHDSQAGDDVPRKGRARRFREARALKQGFDDGLFREGSGTLADVDGKSADDLEDDVDDDFDDEEEDDWDPDHHINN